MSHLGHRKPARIHEKADASKTRHCLVSIIVQRHNWAIFLRKWARRDRYSQWRSLSGHVERIFVHKNCRKGFNRMVLRATQPNHHIQIQWMTLWGGSFHDADRAAFFWWNTKRCWNVGSSSHMSSISSPIRYTISSQNIFCVC